MAERVLPSREAFKQLQHEPMIDGYLPPGWRTVLREFGSGRLVDREAIKYGAAAKALEVWADHLADKAGRWSATVAAVNAALPDQEL